MRVLALWCPDWPITALGHGIDEPVAVISAGRVLACSPSARQAGVRLGLRRREAEGAAPGARIEERDLELEARGFEAVVAAVAEIAPLVEVTRPGALAIESRGPARYFGGEGPLRELVASVAQRAMPVKTAPPVGVGIADGRFAASLAARAGMIVVAGRSAEFLSPFPVEAIGQSDLAELLTRLGITTLGGFAGLPQGAVLARFGRGGLRYHQLAGGGEEGPLHPTEPPEALPAEVELDPPAEQADAATFSARSAAEDLVDRLAQRGLVCLRVRIEAQTAEGEVLARLWRSEGPLQADALIQRLRWQLDGWLSGASGSAPTSGIGWIRLIPDEVVRSDGLQLSLTGGVTDADRRAERGVDRLQAMLGREAVCTAVRWGGRGPADRVLLVPWGEPGPDPGEDRPWPDHLPSPAPASVFPDPRPVSVVDDRGDVVGVNARGQLSTQPARVCLDGRSWVGLLRWSSPWLISERWWDPRGHRRLVRFQFLLDDGSAHLCALERGRWFLEATYD